MNKVIYLGTEFKKGKGGIASVLNEYSKIFPQSYFISTTATRGRLINFLILLTATIKLPVILFFNKNAIVHIHGASYNSFHRKFFLYQIIRIFGNKIIYHIHGGKFHLFYANSDDNKKKKIKNLINNVDGLICLSDFWEDFFLENFDPKKIKTIPNIVPMPSLEKTVKSDRFEFLFLGYISESKGIWLLLDVVESLKNILEDKVVFNIGGNGEIDKLQALVKQKKLSGIVNYIGWVSHKKKIQYLNQSDAYILPSYNEGLPISILEAMTYKLPIISTNVGGIPEVLKDKVNGLLVEPKSKKELKNALEFVINNTAEFKSFGGNSLQFVKPHLPKNVKNELMKFYKNI